MTGVLGKRPPTDEPRRPRHSSLSGHGTYYSYARGGQSAQIKASWNAQMVEDLLEQRFRRDLLRLGFVGDNDAMSEYVVADRLDVLRCHVAAAVQKCHRLGGPREEDGRPRA